MSFPRSKLAWEFLPLQWRLAPWGAGWGVDATAQGERRGSVHVERAEMKRLAWPEGSAQQPGLYSSALLQACHKPCRQQAAQSSPSTSH